MAPVKKRRTFFPSAGLPFLPVVNAAPTQPVQVARERVLAALVAPGEEVPLPPEDGERVTRVRKKPELPPAPNSTISNVKGPAAGPSRKRKSDVVPLGDDNDARATTSTAHASSSANGNSNSRTRPKRAAKPSSSASRPLSLPLRKSATSNLTTTTADEGPALLRTTTKASRNLALTKATGTKASKAQSTNSMLSAAMEMAMRASIVGRERKYMRDTGLAVWGKGKVGMVKRAAAAKAATAGKRYGAAIRRKGGKSVKAEIIGAKPKVSGPILRIRAGLRGAKVKARKVIEGPVDQEGEEEIDELEYTDEEEMEEGEEEEDELEDEEEAPPAARLTSSLGKGKTKMFGNATKGRAREAQAPGKNAKKEYMSAGFYCQDADAVSPHKLVSKVLQHRLAEEAAALRRTNIKGKGKGKGKAKDNSMGGGGGEGTAFRPSFPPLPYDHGHDHFFGQEHDFVLPWDIAKAAQDGSLESKKKPPSYEKLRGNVFPERKRMIADAPAICHCAPGSDCGSNCINRVMSYLCGRDCPAGDTCENRSLAKRRMAPTKVLFTGTRGFGLFATEDIQEGDFVTDYRGEVISLNTFYERIKTDYKNEKNFYALEYDNGEVIDAGMRGNDARFINHGCNPNLEVRRYQTLGDQFEEYEVGMWAIRDIKKGEELFYDYNFDSFAMNDDDLRTRCQCGAPNCVGFLGRKQGEKTAKEIAQEQAAKGKKKATKKVRKAIIMKKSRAKVRVGGPAAVGTAATQRMLSHKTERLSRAMRRVEATKQAAGSDELGLSSRQGGEQSGMEDATGDDSVEVASDELLASPKVGEAAEEVMEEESVQEEPEILLHVVEREKQGVHSDAIPLEEDLPEVGVEAEYAPMVTGGVEDTEVDVTVEVELAADAEPREPSPRPATPTSTSVRVSSALTTEELAMARAPSSPYGRSPSPRVARPASYPRSHGSNPPGVSIHDGGSHAPATPRSPPASASSPARTPFGANIRSAAPTPAPQPAMIPRDLLSDRTHSPASRDYRYPPQPPGSAHQPQPYMYSHPAPYPPPGPYLTGHDYPSQPSTSAYRQPFDHTPPYPYARAPDRILPPGYRNVPIPYPFPRSGPFSTGPLGSTPSTSTYTPRPSHTYTPRPAPAARTSTSTESGSNASPDKPTPKRKSGWANWLKKVAGEKTRTLEDWHHLRMERRRGTRWMLAMIDEYGIQPTTEDGQYGQSAQLEGAPANSYAEESWEKTLLAFGATGKKVPAVEPKARAKPKAPDGIPAKRGRPSKIRLREQEEAAAAAAAGTAGEEEPEGRTGPRRRKRKSKVQKDAEVEVQGEGKGKERATAHEHEGDNSDGSDGEEEEVRPVRQASYVDHAYLPPTPQTAAPLVVDYPHSIPQSLLPTPSTPDRVDDSAVAISPVVSQSASDRETAKRAAIAKRNGAPMGWVYVVADGGQTKEKRAVEVVQGDLPRSARRARASLGGVRRGGSE